MRTFCSYLDNTPEERHNNHYNNTGSLYNNTGSLYNNTGSHYNNTDAHYNNTGSHSNNTGSHYNNTGSHYNNTGSHYNNTGSHSNNTGSHYNNTGSLYNNTGSYYNNTGSHYNNTGSHYNNSGSHYNNTAKHNYNSRQLDVDCIHFFSSFPLRWCCVFTGKLKRVDNGTSTEQEIELPDNVRAATPSDLDIASGSRLWLVRKSEASPCALPPCSLLYSGEGQVKYCRATYLTN